MRRLAKNHWGRKPSPFTLLVTSNNDIKTPLPPPFTHNRTTTTLYLNFNNNKFIDEEKFKFNRSSGR